jgi:Amt family ammonium transporter
MVLLMVPGLGFLYSGLARRKSALSMIYACLGSYSIVCFQWYFWGYSLAFSDTATNGFIGNLRKFGLMNTLAVPSPGSTLIPDLLFAFYQMQFCAVTAAIVAGAVAERGRLIPFFVFIFFWAPLHAGCGARTDGHSAGVSSTTQVADPSRSCLVCPHSPTLWFSDAVKKS